MSFSLRLVLHYKKKDRRIRGGFRWCGISETSGSLEDFDAIDFQSLPARCQCHRDDSNAREQTLLSQRRGFQALNIPVKTRTNESPRSLHLFSGITADEKFKHQQNGNVHRYVYYKCTRTRDQNCPCGFINEEDLIEQLKNLIDDVDIQVDR